MIKRALGAWAADAGVLGRTNDDDSEDDLTVEEKKKLEKRLLPGAFSGKGKKKVAPKKRQERADSDDEDEDEDDADDAWDSSDPEASELDEDSEEEMPSVPQSDREKKPFRGKFQCQLCPDKILLNEKDMELHLASACHKKNEKRFTHAKELGIEAYEAECRAKAEAREQASGKLSKKTLKSASYWEKKRISSKDKKKTTDAETAPSQAEIERRKQAFQAKKARRLERRKAAEEGQEVSTPVPRNRKERRAALQAEQATENSAPRNRKERRAALQASKESGAAHKSADAVVTQAEGKKRKKNDQAEETPAVQEASKEEGKRKKRNKKE